MLAGYIGFWEASRVVVTDRVKNKQNMTPAEAVLAGFFGFWEASMVLVTDRVN